MNIEKELTESVSFRNLQTAPWFPSKVNMLPRLLKRLWKQLWKRSLYQALDQSTEQSKQLP